MRVSGKNGAYPFVAFFVSFCSKLLPLELYLPLRDGSWRDRCWSTWQGRTASWTCSAWIFRVSGRAGITHIQSCRQHPLTRQVLVGFIKSILRVEHPGVEGRSQRVTRSRNMATIGGVSLTTNQAQRCCLFLGGSGFARRRRIIRTGLAAIASSLLVSVHKTVPQHPGGNLPCGKASFRLRFIIPFDEAALITVKRAWVNFNFAPA